MGYELSGNCGNGVMGYGVSGYPVTAGTAVTR